MKLQHIAAAVALAAAGTANAAIDNFATGNGSFFLVAYDITGAKNASLFDLGFNLSDFAGTGTGATAANGTLAAAGTKVVWDLANNTVSVNGSIQNTGVNAWSAALSKLVGNADAGDIRYIVGAGDSVGSPQNQRFLLTGTATTTNQNATNSAALIQSDSLFSNTITSKGTLNQAGIDNGAWTFAEALDGSATAGNGYIFDSTIFSANWKAKNNLTNNTALNGAKQNLWLVQAAGAELAITSDPAIAAPDNSANLLSNRGTLVFSAQAGTLTWETPSAVPEPSTYALALVGLALAGVAARRRRA
nr:PEP-CTERM sorting domain-containing protein [uncultured Aquabacterium sp.]